MTSAREEFISQVSPEMTDALLEKASSEGRAFKRSLATQ